MSVLDNLLNLQEHDTTADQLRHRRAHLPERATLEALAASVSDVERRRTDIAGQRHDLGREQARLEDEVTLVEDKRTQTDAALYSGAVSAPRELQAMQDEIGSLRRRQSTLEDELLEVLTAIEPLDEALQGLDAEQAELDRRIEATEADLAAAEADVDTELARVIEERESVAATVPPDQLASYDDTRRRLGGIAVARLVGTSCGGCHLALSAVEIDRIRRMPSDQPATCEECGRLLVH